MGQHVDDGLKGSPVRLWKLIERRALTPAGPEREAIDRRIWDLFGEEWAVMFTDLSGFSRQVAAFGIIHFLQIIHEQKKLFLPYVEERDGILVKVEADSFLILFKRARAALECAVEMQRASVRANEGRAPEEKILLCVGIGYGAMLRIGDDDVFGAEVNAASKLGEDTAGAGEILVTEGARAAAGVLKDLTYEPLDAVVPGAGACWRVHWTVGVPR